ncbi:PREDICTED: galectin-9 isoform X3 [Myotis brandtii]|uniref:galectin-9 isoform X3 n=1 Tax=Myotis brandtii TaxID=109478 RepID=UPI000703D2D7|nr:PREDICTED: galectin-9 isoform X3 [Myotis brandtii]
MSLICNQLSVVNPVIPFFRLTQGGDRYTLRYGHQIIVKGMFLPSGGNRFEVNFQTGLSDKDIAFHFSPRFEEGGYVVCNTKQKGRWEQEQKMNINPFQMGVPFVISFLVENSGFQVKVNGNFFMNYIHRVPHHRVDTISFTGGVEVTQISIEPPSYWQATASPIMQKVILGHICPNPYSPRKAYSSPPGDHTLETANPFL